MKDGLGDRMKHNYEDRSRAYLTRRTPVIIRLDGRAFHTLTRNCIKPFDDDLIYAMQATANSVFDEVQGSKLIYVQSDEISVLVTDFDTLDTNAWFDYNLQKIVSISASIASVAFTRAYGKVGIFDSRAFNIPRDEVINYFRWRYKDWTRNSLSMLARTYYSQKELHGKCKAEQHEMLHQKDVNWSDLSPVYKNGTLMVGDMLLTDFDLNDDSWINEFDNIMIGARCG